VIGHLRKSPGEPISVEQVAEKADVARSTVYAVFGSRAGLFDAVAADVLERDAYDRLLEAKFEPDAREHLGAGMRSGAEMLAADRDVVRALFSMAPLDPDGVGAAVRRREEERARGMRRLARRLQQQDLLAPGVSAADAEHTLWVLTSFEAFDLLHTGRGLSPNAAARRLTETAERALLR
jgi:AcrR family transcriptional regulator